MTTAHLTAEDVAHFLREHPSFFQEHADVFADLRVPHPHEARAISLGERQIMVLRAKVKDLEWKLSGLVNNASGNEKISRTLTTWCARMLAEPDAGKIPDQIISYLTALFELPDTTLRLWDVGSELPSHYCADVTNAIKDWANTLKTPYCGTAEGCIAAPLLNESIQSMAAIALRENGSASGKLIGLLLLGAPDPDRFAPDMGTAFLEILGELAGSALTRLAAPTE